MKLKQLFFGVLLSASFTSFAQNNNKEVLFTIDGKPYYTDEFARVYNKNIDLVKDESQKDLNQYLDLFVGYKLKINKANKLGLQNGQAYQAELKSYRNQLSKNYLTDSKVTQELIEEAYQRSQKEIKAAHILFMVDENASPEDTLKAYKKAVEVREKALKGENFGDLAVKYSEDPSAKENKGELGYFSAFRMVYPFESAAYKTQKGHISKIVRTRFGYHIIKVEDIRDNRGELTVAHIMILKPNNQNPEEAEKAKATIQDIYKKLQQGENFESLAKQFSQDKSSASKGGVLNRFGSGQLSSEEFEDAAFALKNPNDYSAPVESNFGWHIIKLIEKHPLKTAQEMQSELDGKIRKDERSRLITNSLTEKLKKKYSIKRNDKLFAAISKTVNDKFYTGDWKLPENMKPFEGNLVTIDKKTISGDEFLKYLVAQQRGENTIRPISKLVEKKYQEYVDAKVNELYNNNLENEFPDFAAVMEEYRDGLLLFDLMEKEIWEKAKTDTIGLQNFYEARKNNYRWGNRVDALILSSTKMDMAKKAQKLLKQGKSAEFIKEKFNQNGKVEVMSNAGIFEENSDALPKGLEKKDGVSGIIKDGEYYFVVKINKHLEAGPKTLEEAKGKVVNDYQQYLEEKWVSDLKQEFKVDVNQPAFEKVKKQIKS
ncbi:MULTISPECIES: peptidylprolyl isomerase [Flavobacterium]|jgi:peptidyl-prolyl cis-trans isomerase SurA|uniref:Peptidyl-prolyl cis-trans isomerase SurA n=1 Tax=Flavobacterium lindanitolerans TaxID=428988 RepID=A0A497UVV9_9FLAO|nr:MULTISPECIES: peptidylprolyl isomerase [Flavobacterium]MBU7569286.1 peptidylprolyl isomerase [Flavobacterium sp.]PZO34748.1 MAG: peptidyl-prolyl cis-trans isomerase [Flavobacteriaceae bacterium]KQS47248.1 peptidylprolyl isomerase [Flavobacterium sp. Leaf359]MDQ7961863.1 peptidylprolyl isomerase [Flavobacterium lindanitolerans]OJX52213.1 MAG: peptidylprolyl isomerase [Flavobacterium sp. 38-13]